MKKLFDSGELGKQNPRTAKEAIDDLVLPRSLFWPTILSLRETPQEVEYFELNRSSPGPLQLSHEKPSG